MARRHVLIGSGPASISAAETIREADPGADITVVAAEPSGYYSRPGLAYYLAREIPESQLFPFTAEDLERLGARFVRATVVALDPGAHSVRLDDGSALAYDRLLVATGSRAVPLDVPGADLDGVVSLDDLHDARDLIRRARSAKAAVVIGGGITALEIAEGLKDRRLRVHYLMRRDRYWSNVLSETESRIVEDGLRECGVQIHTFAESAEILGRKGKVAGVRTTSGDEIECQLVAVAVGVRPVVKLAEEAGIACSRGILVDEYLRSNQPDIYAAGDAAEVADEATGRRAIEVLWSSAVQKGRIAGLNMATEPTTVYRKAAPLNVTRLAGFKITIIGTVGSGRDSDLQGIARGDSETWRRLGEAQTVESRYDDTHVRLAIAGGTIVGAVVVGDQALSFPLQELVEARVDLGSVAGDLLAPGARVGELLETLWHDWSGQRV